ncbi:MAG: ParA family protein [Pseudomonadota bacterium]
MRTVLVANRKGGVGKSLIAVNLAAALAHQNVRVAVADADRQRSSLGWLSRRPSDVPQIRGLDWTKASDIGEHPKRLDWLIIDAPGSLKDSKAEALIATARAVLTPVQPSVFDQDATKGFLEEVEELKRVRKGKARIHLVANRIKARSRAANNMDYYLDELGYAPLTWLSERAVYAELAASGRSIFDRRLAALAPIKAQWAPIFDALGG